MMDLKLTQSKNLAVQLSEILSDEFILFVKTRNAQWNIADPHTYPAHNFFEEQCTEINGIIASIAQRIHLLGHNVPASLKQFLELAHISDYRDLKNDNTTLIKDLLFDHETIIGFLREHVGIISNRFNDVDTNDYINSIIKKHEDMCWLLRAHI